MGSFTWLRADKNISKNELCVNSKYNIWYREPTKTYQKMNFV